MAKDSDKSTPAYRREYARKWRAANIDKVRANYAKTWAKIKERRNAELAEKRRDPSTGPLLREKDKQRYHKDVEKSRAKARENCARQGDKLRKRKRNEAMQARRKKGIPPKGPRLGGAMYYAKRRAHQAGIPGSHTTQEWTELCAAFQDRCVCCGKHKSEIQLTKDHVVPVSNPLSTDYISNIQPLCRSCNARKKNRQAIDYRRTPFQGRGQSVMFA